MELEPSTFLAPFLELVRSEETSGWITGLALTSLNKFIAYGFIGTGLYSRCSTRLYVLASIVTYFTCGWFIVEYSDSACSAVESIADAVTHARFVGTDPESDEVVLMKILQVR